MKFLKKSKKLIIGIIIGLIIGSVVSVYAAYSYFAEDVSYASSNGTEISVQEALDQLYAKENSGSSLTVNYTGYYADVNDDGTVDGVIFVDLAHGAVGTWGDINGEYFYSVTSNLKNYKISTIKSSYSGKFGTRPVVAPNGTSGNARFYVMALSDFDTSIYHTWSDAKSKTQTVGSVTFRLPSKMEWAAFGGQLGITTPDYASTYGLRGLYWSSTEYDSSHAWGARLAADVDILDLYSGEDGYNYVRLCATF